MEQEKDVIKNNQIEILGVKKLVEIRIMDELTKRMDTAEEWIYQL